MAHTSVIAPSQTQNSVWDVAAYRKLLYSDSDIARTQDGVVIDIRWIGAGGKNNVKVVGVRFRGSVVPRLGMEWRAKCAALDAVDVSEAIGNNTTYSFAKIEGVGQKLYYYPNLLSRAQRDMEPMISYALLMDEDELKRFAVEYNRG